MFHESSTVVLFFNVLQIKSVLYLKVLYKVHIKHEYYKAYFKFACSNYLSKEKADAFRSSSGMLVDFQEAAAE